MAASREHGSSLNGYDQLRMGAIGEAAFLQMVQVRPFLVSKVEPDLTGKDFWVEVEPSGTSDEVWHDGEPAPLQILIQVKSLLKGARRFSLTLSNAKRLAKDLKPVAIFITVLDPDRHMEVIETYLKHISFDEVSRILRALRRASSRRKDDINKSTITFGFGKQILSKEDLRDGLLELVSPDMFAYQRRKADHVETAGFTEVRNIIECENDDDFIMNVVRNDVSPLSLSLFERRFEIDQPKGHYNGPIAIQPRWEGPTRLRIEAGDDVLDIPCQFGLLPSAVIFELPIGRMSVNVRGYKFAANKHIRDGAPLDIALHDTYYRLRRLFCGTTFSVMAELPGKGWLGESLDGGNDHEMRSEWNNICLVIEYTLGLPRATAVPLPIEYLWKQREFIELYYFGVMRGDSMMRYRFSAIPRDYKLRSGGIIVTIRIAEECLSAFIPMSERATAEPDLFLAVQNGPALTRTFEFSALGPSLDAFQKEVRAAYSLDFLSVTEADLDFDWLSDRAV